MSCMLTWLEICKWMIEWMLWYTDFLILSPIYLTLVIDGWDSLIWKIDGPIVDGWMRTRVFFMFGDVSIMDGRE